MRKTLFTIDGFNYPHIGYTAGIRWNGWATPHFEIDEALKVMEEFNKEQPEHPIIYAEASDTFMMVIADDEIDLWKGRNYQTEDGIKHLYSIGAYSWVWEDVTQQDIYCIAQRIAEVLLDIGNIYMDEDDIVKQLQDFDILKRMISVIYCEDLNDVQMCAEFGAYLKLPAFNAGTIVAVNGNIYEYVGFDDHLKMHQLSEIDLDEDGHMTATYGVVYMPDEEFAFSEEGTEYFSPKKWYGIVECFIRQDYDDLTEMEISGAVMDIVDRCFAYGVPKMHKLAEYIAEYLDR